MKFREDSVIKGKPISAISDSTHRLPISYPSTSHSSISDSPTQGIITAWSSPPLVKLDPVTARPIHLKTSLSRGAFSQYNQYNAVWQKGRTLLEGIRGEYASFQICIETPLPGLKTLTKIKIIPRGFKGIAEFELYKNWYAKTREGQWQPAYAIPLKERELFSLYDGDTSLSDGQNRVPGQSNQSVYGSL